MFLGSLLLLSSIFCLAKGQTAGGTIKSVDPTDINSALDIILNNVGILDFTRISVGVANLGDRQLISPQWYLKSGDTDHTMPFVIPNSQTGLNLFVSKTLTVFGTDGVITYDIEGTPLCVAIMWHVPNIGSNTMNVKVYPKLEPGRDLYNQMRDVAGEWGPGQWGENEEFGVKVVGSITSGWVTKQIIYVDSTGYDISQGPSYISWCDWNLIGSDYCVRECSPIGTCDTNNKCNDDRDCDGSKLSCSDPCS